MKGASAEILWNVATTPSVYRSPTRRHLERHLPQALVATACVTVLPVAITGAVMPTRGFGEVLEAIALAVALSLAIAAAGSAMWKRHPVSHELVFADMMIWSWLYRLWIERRLRAASYRVAEGHPPSAAEHVQALERLGTLLEARDSYTHGHSQRVTRHVEAIARAMHLSPDQVRKCLTAAAVHDVGKIYTPREILNKPDRLSDTEYEVVKRHPLDGVEMLGEIDDPEIRAMVRHHHERLDGRGYPDGLRGDEIPLGARIIAVADTFDAMTSSRAYRRACTHKRALDTLRSESGTQLDPDAVAAFRTYYSAWRPVAGTTLVLAGLQRLWAGFGPSPSVIGGFGAALPVAGAIALLGLSHANPPSPVHHQRADSSSIARGVSLAAQPLAAVVLPAAHRLTVSAPSRAAHHRRHHQAATPHRHHAGRPAGSGQSTGGRRPAGTPTSPGSSGSGGSQSAGGTGAPASSASASSPSSSGSNPSSGGSPTTRTLPPVGTPPVSTPEVHTPSVSTPAVSTPAVSTPPVSVGPVHVPSVTVPAITVPAVTVPSVTVPSVTVPGLPIGIP